MKKHQLFIALLFLSLNIHAQNIGIGTTTPDASAMLDVSSNNTGLLIPRLTIAQRNAIPTPATGLLIYQTDNAPNFYYIYFLPHTCNIFIRSFFRIIV